MQTAASAGNMWSHALSAGKHAQAKSGLLLVFRDWLKNDACPDGLHRFSELIKGFRKSYIRANKKCTIDSHQKPPYMTGVRDHG